MSFKGIARGKLIELDQSLPFSEGQRLNVSIEPLAHETGESQAQRILRVLREGPHVDPADVEAMMKVIEEARLPTRYDAVFHNEKA